MVKKKRGLAAWLFLLQYWPVSEWLYHVLFNNDYVLRTRHPHTFRALYGPSIDHGMAQDVYRRARNELRATPQ